MARRGLTGLQTAEKRRLESRIRKKKDVKKSKARLAELQTIRNERTDETSHPGRARGAQTQRTPTLTQPTASEKAPIVLNEPKEEGIVLNEPAPQKTQGRQNLEDVTKVALAVGGGVVLGAGAFLAGSALAGAGATQAAINSGFAQQIAAQTSTSVSKAAQVGRVTATATTNFAVNAKTAGLTTSFLGKVGLTIGAASLAVGIIGSYPFAGFIKEEALQTLSFSVKSAKDSGDLEGEQAAIDQVNEILNPSAWEKILASVPFLNVHTQLVEFYKAAATKNAADQVSLDKRKAEVAAGESEFERTRRESDEAARGRDITAQEEDTERFAEIEETNRQAKLREQELDSQYFKLIREKKFDEAEELLQSRIKG